MKTASAIMAAVLAGLWLGAYAATGQGVSVAGIDRKVKAFDSKIGGFRKTERYLNGLSTGGSTVTSYSKGRRIDKIRLESFGETGRAIQDFYFWDGTLLFMRHRVIGYEGVTTHSPDGNDGLRESTTTDFRLYFSNDTLLRWTAVAGAAPGGEVRAAALQGFTDSAYSVLALMRQGPERGPCKEGWGCTERSGGRCVKYRCAGP
ncbi:MAG: hypothetical protein JXA20_14370 [Spirochaetes bacterium]|nr:hypothetical protein [Spirochaetota bacterium]